jgi:Flp pilus assembly protein TadG
MFRHWRAGHGESGAAFVELAVSLPVLVAIVLGTADLGRVFYYTIELTNAARAGAQYAGYNSVFATQGAQITAAAQNAAPNISPAVTVTFPAPGAFAAPQVCRCAADDGSSFGSPVSCNSVCPVNQHMFETVTVTVSYTFRTISMFPGLPNTLTITRTATMRVAI